MVDLKQYKGGYHGAFIWKKSLPFVDNARAVLIHRPKRVSDYQLGTRRPHIGIEYWCGNHVSGMEKFTFLAVPPEGRMICLACEEKAFLAGEKTSDQIVGHHVCKGRVKAYSACCGYKAKNGTATPVLDFGAAVGNTNVNMRHYSGGIEIQNMGAAGTDTMSLEGHGQHVLNANCTGGTLAVRGHFKKTDNSGSAVEVISSLAKEGKNEKAEKIKQP